MSGVKRDAWKMTNKLALGVAIPPQAPPSLNGKIINIIASTVTFLDALALSLSLRVMLPSSLLVR